MDIAGTIAPPLLRHLTTHANLLATAKMLVDNLILLLDNHLVLALARLGPALLLALLRFGRLLADTGAHL